MESKKLEALLMAVDLGSFTKAAEVMGYTQSGLTHMMNSLEREVGFRLNALSGIHPAPQAQQHPRQQDQPRSLFQARGVSAGFLDIRQHPVPCWAHAGAFAKRCMSGYRLLPWRA